MNKQPNVVLIQSYSWLPPGPAYEKFDAVGRAQIQDWDAASFYDQRAVLYTVTDLIAHISKEAPKGEIPSVAWIPENLSGTGTIGTYDYAVSAMVPTRWGFASGYGVQICMPGKCFAYAGGTVDPNLSSASPLPIAQPGSN